MVFLYHLIELNKGIKQLNMKKMSLGVLFQ